MKRVLLIGGSGQLGTAIRQRWTDCDIVAPPHAELAIERCADVRDALERVRPEVLVNAAAFHDVDRCEEEPELAFVTNSIAVGRAARLASERDVLFVTISTDYVFDGTTSEPYSEDAPAHPLSTYGMSKLAGEYLAQRIEGRAFVVRTCGLYGVGESSSRRPLIERVLTQTNAQDALRVVVDVFVSPTFAGDLAAALRQLVETESYGLYHAVNVGPVSWYEFVVAAIELSGKEVSVEPILADEWTQMAIRPRFSALENSKLGALGITMPSWRAGIAAYLGLRGTPD